MEVGEDSWRAKGVAPQMGNCELSPTLARQTQHAVCRVPRSCWQNKKKTKKCKEGREWQGHPVHTRRRTARHCSTIMLSLFPMQTPIVPCKSMNRPELSVHPTPLLAEYVPCMTLHPLGIGGVVPTATTTSAGWFDSCREDAPTAELSSCVALPRPLRQATTLAVPQSRARFLLDITAASERSRSTISFNVHFELLVVTLQSYHRHFHYSIIGASIAYHHVQEIGRYAHNA